VSLIFFLIISSSALYSFSSELDIELSSWPEFEESFSALPFCLFIF